MVFEPAETGHDPLPIVFARLGLGSELADTLRNWPEQFQFYPNGWTHWGLDVMKAESTSVS